MLAEEMEAAQGALVTRAAPPDTAARDSSGSSSRFAQQTLQVFVPLAHRLGMWYFKGELEQRCFALTKPRDFERISSEVSAMECPIECPIECRIEIAMECHIECHMECHGSPLMTRSVSRTRRSRALVSALVP